MVLICISLVIIKTFTFIFCHSCGTGSKCQWFISDWQGYLSLLHTLAKLCSKAVTSQNRGKGVTSQNRGLPMQVSFTRSGNSFQSSKWYRPLCSKLLQGQMYINRGKNKLVTLANIQGICRAQKKKTVVWGRKILPFCDFRTHITFSSLGDSFFSNYNLNYKYLVYTTVMMVTQLYTFVKTHRTQ